MRFFRTGPLLLAAALAPACSDPAEPNEEPAPETHTVEVGVPDQRTRLDFVPLEPGSEIPLETFGQGGTHILLGVRARGFGARAYVAITIENLQSGVQIVAPAPTSPQLFYCHDGVCDLVPLNVMMAGLAAPDEERDGLPIAIEVEVHDDSGARAETRAEATLNTDLL